MSFEEEFDKRIRQKMEEEASFPFDEANWAKASLMIDAERKAAKVARFTKYHYLASAFVTATLGVVLWTYFKPADTTTAAIQEKNTTSPVTESPAKSEAFAAPLVTSSSINKTEIGAIAAAGNENTISQKPATLPAINVQQEKGIPVTPAKYAVPETTHSQNTSSAKPEEPSTQGNDRQFNMNSDGVPQQQSLAEKAKDASNDGTSVINKEVNETTPSEGAALPDVTTISEREPTTLSGAAGETTQRSEEALTVDYMTLRGIQQDAAESDIIAMPLVLLQRYDEDYYKKARAFKHHFMNVEAGTDYNLGWETASGWDGRGINWLAGVNYGYCFTKKLAVGAGIQAYNLQNTKDPFFATSKTDYDYGSTASGTVISNKNVWYAALPVKLYYMPNAFNQFGIGANVGYLVSETSRVQTFTIREGAKVYDPAYTAKGIYNGSNQLNVMFSAFYKLQLCKRMGVNAEFVYGMNDLFKNTANIKTSEKPIGFRLSIQYTLFER
jgi:hypothetical protein